MESHARVHGEPGSLYARCGGIFGIATFVDLCMDLWMADAVLNANPAVATWHTNYKRCGFKFLVAQLLGSYAGGPQHYTGRPMDQSHKHMAITGEEWSHFMKILDQVCKKLALHRSTEDDLRGLFESWRRDIILQPGETPLENKPVALDLRTLYGRLGGVYPIALFADRLVDALLSDESFGIPTEELNRDRPSLVYLFTEMVCNSAGGMEQVTCSEAVETRLLLPPQQWDRFMVVASMAADHFPKEAAKEVPALLENMRGLIVDVSGVGIDEEQAEVQAGLPVVKCKDAAGAGVMLSAAQKQARRNNPGQHIAGCKRVFGDPRTLYGRSGGVFGLARISTALMNAWMESPALNANEKVARWNESAQSEGFKFLVTQIMCYLTGGPQRYTGRPMVASHKHLNISPKQWDHFMSVADDTLHEIGLETHTYQELRHILASFRSQVIVCGHEKPAEDPGLSRPPEDTAGTLYFALGGVYPLARFVSALADRILDSASMELASSAMNDEAYRPGLKYMMTEVVCNGAGGPETVTSHGFTEVKLRLDTERWPTFLKIAGSVAEEVWPAHKGLREQLLAMLESIKAEISCQDVPDDEPFVEEQPAICRATTSELAPSPSGGCPFGFGRAGSSVPAGHHNLRLPVSSIRRDSDSPPRRESERLDELCNARECLTSLPEHVMLPGRCLEGPFQAELDELLEEDPELCCPVSLTLLVEPVYASDEFTYEKASADVMIRSRRPSPMSHEFIAKKYKLNTQCRDAVLTYRRSRAEALIEFAEKVFSTEPGMAGVCLTRVTSYLRVLKPQQEQQLAARASDLWRRIGHPVPQELQTTERARRVSRRLSCSGSIATLPGMPVPSPEPPVKKPDGSPSVASPHSGRTPRTRRKQEVDLPMLDMLLSSPEAAKNMASKYFAMFSGEPGRFPGMVSALESKFGVAHTPLLLKHVRRTLFQKRGPGADFHIGDAATSDQVPLTEEEWREAFDGWLHAIRVRCGQVQIRRHGMVKTRGLHKLSDFGELYFKGPKLGEGAFGEVFLMLHKSLNVERVVKVIKKEQLTEAITTIEDEVNVLRTLDHPHVVRIFETFDTQQALHIVMDYAEGGDLASLLSRALAQQSLLPEQWICFCSDQFISALAYIHSKGVVHCDLKPANVMLLKPFDEDHAEDPPHVLLADFGLSEMFDQRSEPGGPVRAKGTPVYLAPEAFDGHLTEKSDMWASGIMIYEMMVGKRPFKASSSVFAIWNAVSKQVPDYGALPEYVQDLVKGLLAKDPVTRLSAEACRSFAWFASCRVGRGDGSPCAEHSQKVVEQMGHKSYFHRAAMFCIATELSIRQMGEVFEIFRSLDQTGCGRLDVHQLEQGLKQLGIAKDPAALMSILDLDQNGFVSYTEFLTGVLSTSRNLSERLLQEAFDIFDVNGDGVISLAELQQMLSGDGPLVEMLPDGQTVEEVMDEVSNGTEIGRAHV